MSADSKPGSIKLLASNRVNLSAKLSKRMFQKRVGVERKGGIKMASPRNKGGEGERKVQGSPKLFLRVWLVMVWPDPDEFENPHFSMYNVHHQLKTPGSIDRQIYPPSPPKIPHPFRVKRYQLQQWCQALLQYRYIWPIPEECAQTIVVHSCVKPTCYWESSRHLERASKN